MKNARIVILIIVMIFVRTLYPKADDVDKVKASSNKVVFLTFDDGPSTTTDKILETLNRYNVKATFFVIGAKVDENPNEAKKLKDNGMAIFPHCYIHNYDKIYKSEEIYMNDLEKCYKAIENVTGRTNKTFVRFPGGSANTFVNKRTFNSIKDRLKKEGINYVDWNVSSEDATVCRLEANNVVRNVVNGYRGCSIAVILMHDSESKVTTAQALPDIIESLQSRGYEFKTFDDISREELNKMINLRIVNR